jgi:hypothetical protein
VFPQGNTPYLLPTAEPSAPHSLVSPLHYVSIYPTVFALSRDPLSAQRLRGVLMSSSGTILAWYDFCSYGSLAKASEDRS